MLNILAFHSHFYLFNLFSSYKLVLYNVRLDRFSINCWWWIFHHSDWKVFNTMKLLILLVLIPLFSSTKIRVRLPSLPPVLSEIREIKEKFIAQGLNNIGLRINNKMIRKTPTTTTSTTTTTTTTPEPTTTNKTQKRREQIGVESKKLVSLITSHLNDVRDKTKDSSPLSYLWPIWFNWIWNIFKLAL